MQNVHSHAWTAEEHMQPSTIAEADRSRGFKLDLSVTRNAFLADMAIFEKTIVFGLKARRTGFWVPDEVISEFVKGYEDRLIGFAAADPTQPEHMEELTHAVKTLGLRGLKLGPIYAGFDPRDPICDPMYQFCQKESLPILFHAGTTFNQQAPIQFGKPEIFDAVGAKYPGLRIILAHMGHPWMEECMAVIRKHPHMYADVSALYYRPWQYYNGLVAAQEYKIGHKLMFGTDYPFAKAQESVDGLKNINSLTEGTRLPRISEDMIDGILNRDSCALLGLK